MKHKLISKVAVCPDSVNTPWNFGLMITAFKYCKPIRNIFEMMQVIKVSDVRTTTHFPMEGLDYLMPEYFSDMEFIKYSDVPFNFEPINYN